MTPPRLTDSPTARLAFLTACVEEHERALTVLLQHVEQRKAQIADLTHEMTQLRQHIQEEVPHALLE